MKKIPVGSLGVVAVCVLLAGCGGSGAPKLAEGTYRTIVVSTNDCSMNPKLSFEVCSEAINGALASHDEKTPSYDTLRACTATESQDSCERDLNQKYRPRLLAYLVETYKEKPPKGVPLYSAGKNKAGFRDAEKTVYNDTDLTIDFSRRSIAVFNQNLPAGKKKRAF